MKPLITFKGLCVVLLTLQASFVFSQSTCDPTTSSLNHFESKVPQFIELYLGGYCVSDSITDTTIYMRFYPQGKNGMIYWAYSSPIGYPLTVTDISIYDSNCLLVSEGQMVMNLNNTSVYYVKFDIRTKYVDNFCPYFLPVYALAVDFGLVIAEQLNEVIQVTWTTLSETNSHYFKVECSYDLVNWIGLTTINAAGNSSTSLTYFTQVRPPQPGLVYIRIVEYDYNGNITISSVIYTKYNPEHIYNRAVYDLAGRLIRIN